MYLPNLQVTRSSLPMTWACTSNENSIWLSFEV